jgi:hypothetical protein
LISARTPELRLVGVERWNQQVEHAKHFCDVQEGLEADAHVTGLYLAQRASRDPGPVCDLGSRQTLELAPGKQVLADGLCRDPCSR